MYRRAQFIWTPRQQVDSSVTFRSLLVHGPLRRDDGCNRWFLFRRQFELPYAADSALVNVTADSRYKLYVNGEQVGRGPVRATPAFMRVDSHDVTHRLHRGSNVIAALVHVYGVDTAWYETVRDYTQAVFGDGGLYVDATIRAGDRTINLLSDDQWRVTEASAWRRGTPRSGWGQGFIEDFDARRMPDGWLQARFDDSAWDPAQPMLRPASDDDLAKGWGDIEPFTTLLPREIPSLVECARLPSRIVAVNSVVRRPDLELDRRIYDEPLELATAECVDDVEAMLRDDESATVIRTDEGRDVSVLVAFDRRHAGYPFVELDASGGEVIEIAAAETIPGEYGPQRAGPPRIARESYLDCAQVFRYTAHPGPQQFEKFDWTGVKYLQLVVRNAPQGLRIVRLGSTATHYPAEDQGSFRCSDELLNRLWEVGRYTALQCTHDAWEDCPGREKRQWLGDGIVHYLIDAAAFGTSTQPIDRQFLLQATESQRPDGLLQMFAPGDHHSGGIIIPDFNLHWICAAHHYLMHTGDEATIEQLLPAVQRSLAWFERQSGPHDLLANVPHWHFIEWARVGRQGEAFIINAMLAGALHAAADMARTVGYARLSQRYLDWAARIRRALRTRHYDRRRGVFVDSVEPASGQQDSRVSQQANSMAILFDVATPEEYPAIVEYITDERRLRRTATPPVTFDADPFDATTDVVRANTYFCHFLYSALGKAQRFDLALRHMRHLYGAMLATGTETLWESTEPVASLCHAFSATPVYQLPAHVLGVTPTSPGFQRARVAPQFGDLESAHGVYPTPRGGLGVHWQRSAHGDLEVRLDIPVGIEVEFIPPEGYDPAAAPLGAGSHALRLKRREESST